MRFLTYTVRRDESVPEHPQFFAKLGFLIHNILYITTSLMLMSICSEIAAKSSLSQYIQWSLPYMSDSEAIAADLHFSFNLEKLSPYFLWSLLNFVI